MASNGTPKPFDIEEAFDIMERRMALRSAEMMFGPNFEKADPETREMLLEARKRQPDFAEMRMALCRMMRSCILGEE